MYCSALYLKNWYLFNVFVVHLGPSHTCQLLCTAVTHALICMLPQHMLQCHSSSMAPNTLRKCTSYTCVAVHPNIWYGIKVHYGSLHQQKCCLIFWGLFWCTQVTLNESAALWQCMLMHNILHISACLVMHHKRLPRCKWAFKANMLCRNCELVRLWWTLQTITLVLDNLN